MQMKPDTFRFLQQLFEVAPVHCTLPDICRRFSLQEAEWVLKQVFTRDGFRMYIAVDGADDIREVVEIERGKFAYYDLGYVPVPANDLARYRYRTDWLPQKLRQGLHLSGKQEVVLEGQLWLLGHFKHHDVNEPLWLAKGLNQGKYFDAVYDALLSSPGGQTGIVLSHTQPVSKRASLPGSYRIIDPYDLLNEQGYLCGEKLYQYLKPHKTREDTLVHWDDSRGLLYLKGRSPIEFKGPKAKTVIRLLYECCLEKDNCRNEQALLEEAGSSSSRLRDLLKSNPLWQEAIGVNKGTCWLKLPAD